MQIRNNRLEIYFVIKNKYKNENEVSDDMQLAFMNTADWKLSPKWIRQDELDDILNETGKVFVFEEFKDELIKNFQKTHPNARILGPRCLLSCYMENIPVPNTPSPIFNLAMNNLVVCTSKLSSKERKKIEQLVGYMGGEFTIPLTTKTTHLIVTSALAQRHFIACEKDIPTMTCGWVEEVWELNSREYVKANDYNILKKYSCPIFYNIKATGSSISREEKLMLQKKINDNGGSYSQDLQNKITNILITPSAVGEKFKYAVRWGIPCVQPAWVDECILKGHTIPYDNYIVRSGSETSSTQVPKHNSQNPVSFIDTNESEISIIPSNIDKTSVNDTETKISESTIERCMPSVEASEFKTPTKSCPRKNQPAQVSQCNLSNTNNSCYKEVLNDIDLKELKKCGPIFDGCKLFLAGFNTSEEEKLKKILNYGGALRFTELNDSITHIVVGNPTNIEIQQIQNFPNRPHVVKLDWLCHSIKQKNLAKEISCAFFEDDKIHNQKSSGLQQPSPLSKKGFQILNPDSLEKLEIPQIPIVDRNLIEKYSQTSQDIEYCRPEPIPAPNSAVSAPVANSTGQAISEHQSVPLSSTLFTGLKFAIIGHDMEATETFKNTILEYGGSVVTNSKIVVDYVIVPMVQKPTKVTSNEIVTTLWLEDCLYNMKVMDVKYYHLPISTTISPKPLSNCVITLSSYDRHEKAFLENLAKILGAICQDVLSKKNNPDCNILPTTHLICARPQGNKYDAAKKWKLPIVTHSWIRDCYKNMDRLPVEDYLTMFVKTDSNKSGASQTVEPQKICRAEPEASTSKVAVSRRSISSEEIPNFCSAATSTKIGDVLKDVNKCHQEQTKKYSLRASRSTNEVTTPANCLNSNSTASRSSSPGENANKVDECSRVSKSNNGPTSLLLEMNASKGRNNTSTGKRKSRDDSSDRKFRSPKKKVPNRDNHILTPVEEVGWHDTLTDLSHNDAGSSSLSSTTVQFSQKNLTSSNRTQHYPTASSQRGKCGVEKSEAVAVKQPKPMNFYNIMISLEIERNKLEEQIANLGGTVVATYEPECKEFERATHLIIEELKKTEKMLCSIAAGLWVLRASYLEASFENNVFVKEEDHEWGNPKNATFLENFSAETKQLAAAAHYWRIKILKGGPSKRPFVGMKAVIASPNIDGTVLSLQRIIKAGGGRILQPKDILRATHCFLKTNNCLDNILAPLEVLAREKIHVLHAIYLRDFLINQPPPEPETKYVSEYQQVFKQIFRL